MSSYTKTSTLSMYSPGAMPFVSHGMFSLVRWCVPGLPQRNIFFATVSLIGSQSLHASRIPCRPSA